jgi:poly(A) polymerase
MGHPSSDIDIATDAPPQEILNLFPHTILVGLAFGVVIVALEGHQYEVSTFRKDLAYENGRTPIGIMLSGPEEDALRRDFTINGMFFDPLKEQILDFVGGREDIHRKVIRAIGDPSERFREDRLRMVRAIRFAARFDFIIDQETQDGIWENAPSLLPAVAMERIWQELKKMAAYPRLDHAMIEMHRLGLLPVIFPSLAHVHLNDIKHFVDHFNGFPPSSPPILYIKELFPSASMEELLEIFIPLRISGEEIKWLEYMHRLEESIKMGDGDDVSWAYLYAHPYYETCLQVFSARFQGECKEQFLLKHRLRRQALSEHIKRISNKKPLVNANFLQKHGIAPGRLMGKLLQEAEKIAISRDLHQPDAILEILKQSSMWPQ